MGGRVDSATFLREIHRADGTIGYTRDGSFKLNSQGQVVTTDGLPVLSGFQAVPTGTSSVTISQNGQVTMQAAMIAYDNQFQMMMVLSLGVIPFVLLLRATRKSGPAQAVAVE